MSNDIDDLKKVLDDSQISISDIHFIIKYLKKEDISAQLAMRRIKSFDKLQEKLNDNKDKEEIKILNEKLANAKTLIADTEKKYELLQKDTEEWENKSNLLQSETEQLKEQLEMLQELHMADIEKEDKEQQEMVDSINSFIDELKLISSNNKTIEVILTPILTNIKMLLEEKSSNFEKDKYISLIEEIILKSAKKYFEDNKERFIPKEEEKKVSQPIIKQTPVTSTPSKLNTSYKVNKPKPIVKKKIVEEENKVSEQTIKVLNLFLDFIDEANTKDEFQKRVAAICDTDEAYEHLGSIALSQVYSFSSKDLSKKPQLVKLLKSWMKTGVPW